MTMIISSDHCKTIVPGLSVFQGFHHDVGYQLTA
jgi:hypothetical protein